MKNNLRIPALVLALALAASSGATLAFAQGAYDDDDQPVVGTPTLSEERARTIANDAYTGTGSYSDIELEMEDGVLVYSVEFTERDGNEVDVKINAKTGDVVLIESDRDEAMDDDVGDVEDDDDDTTVGSSTTLDVSNLTTAQMEQLLTLLQQLMALMQEQQTNT